MKWAFAAFVLFVMGMIGVMIFLFFTATTVPNEQDYYVLKEAAEAAMIDSIDIAYYRLTGEIKINQEKFVTNFYHRFYSVSTYGKGDYSIEYYDISESPAKVSIKIIDNTRNYILFNSNVDSSDSGLKTRIYNELTLIIDGKKGNC